MMDAEHEDEEDDDDDEEEEEEDEEDEEVDPFENSFDFKSKLRSKFFMCCKASFSMIVNDLDDSVDGCDCGCGCDAGFKSLISIGNEDV